MRLLTTATVTVDDVSCRGDAEHDAAPTSPRLEFAYRGVYVRELGGEQAVVEPGQVLFHNPRDAARVRHPVRGGHAALLLTIDEGMLRELCPPGLLGVGPAPAFCRQLLRIDPRAQVLVTLLRYGLREGVAELLEAESLALTLANRSLGPATTHAASGSAARQRLVDRTKLVLAGDLSRRWALAEIGAQVGVSPVYLTQVFQQVEGVPLYRYQLRLRLARALDLLGDAGDLTALGLELGFSSHSHFTAAFQKVYGRTPTELRQAVLRGRGEIPPRART
jgi:AraC-like DNA-binding protein